MGELISVYSSLQAFKAVQPVIQHFSNGTIGGFFLLDIFVLSVLFSDLD